MKILDVGGHHNTYKDATHIIDILPKPRDCSVHYTQHDICEAIWPFRDKEFDFVYCSQVLEDVKNPAFVIREMTRVGKKCRLITPSVITECSIGIDGWPKSYMYSGYYHHRWLFIPFPDKLVYVMKTPITHIFDWTGHILQEEKEEKKDLIIDWEDNLNAEEIIRNDWKLLYGILKDYFGKDPMRTEMQQYLIATQIKR